jgi:hypothetical protein
MPPASRERTRYVGEARPPGKLGVNHIGVIVAELPALPVLIEHEPCRVCPGQCSPEITHPETLGEIGAGAGAGGGGGGGAAGRAKLAVFPIRAVQLMFGH